jgi:hypothetical protein
MKKLILSCFMALSLFGIPSNSFSMEPVRIDVLFMNHGPMRPTLRDLKDLFSRYAGKIAVSDYDSESEEGEAFKSKMGITRHIPLVIWIDRESTVQVNGKPVTFSGFPTGSGPSFYQGKWKIGDLEMALDQATSKH